MKQSFILVAMLLSFAVNAQDTTKQVFTVVESMPTSKDGNVYKWVKSQISKEVVKSGLNGIVHVEFIIEKNGSVSNVKVIKGADEILNNEAKRIVKLMKWKPAKQRGKKVRLSYTLKIKF